MQLAPSQLGEKADVDRAREREEAEGVRPVRHRLSTKEKPGRRQCLDNVCAVWCTPSERGGVCPSGCCPNPTRGCLLYLSVYVALTNIPVGELIIEQHKEFYQSKPPSQQTTDTD